MSLDVIERAAKRNPLNGFVMSCRNFFEQRGFLSVKQITALERVGPSRGNGGHRGLDRDEIDFGCTGGVNGDY